MNIYEKTGLQKVINASGKMTILGGSVLADKTAEAFKEGSQNYVVIDRLMDKAGEIISRYTEGEASCVTSSASSGIAIAIAAVVAGENLLYVENIHSFDIEKREIIIQKGHVVNYGASVKTMIELGGGILREIGQSNQTDSEHIERAINEKTAGIFYVKSHHAVQKGMLSLEETIKIGNKYNIPVIIDAAAEEDLKKYVKAGADMVIYSGSKAVEGPASGFITGKKKLIKKCKLQYKGIGRAMKVDKGIIMALLEALELYSKKDEHKIETVVRKKVENLAKMLKELPHVKSGIIKDEAGREIYRAELWLGEDSSKSAEELIKELESGNPAIYTRNYYKNQGKIHFDLRSVSEEELELIHKRLKEIL